MRVTISALLSPYLRPFSARTQVLFIRRDHNLNYRYAAIGKKPANRSPMALIPCLPALLPAHLGAMIDLMVALVAKVGHAVVMGLVEGPTAILLLV